MPEKPLRETLLSGRKENREFKTCTPLPGTTKLLKPNSPQLPPLPQPISSSTTPLKFPTTGELLLKLMRIFIKKLEVISTDTLKPLDQPKEFSRMKLTPNGFHKLKESTNLTFKSSRKLPTIITQKLNLMLKELIKLCKTPLLASEHQL